MGKKSKDKKVKTMNKVKAKQERGKDVHTKYRKHLQKCKAQNFLYFGTKIS